METLQFYIIITPRSLKYLKFALWSLQQRKDINVTLVSNGLNNDEKKDLKSFCSEINCAYKEINTNSVLRHGDALNLLLKQHDQRWFCFCDSDIISINKYASDIPLSKNVFALSSCDAMFWDDNPVKGVLGRCNRWPDGSPNLSSFFCIYHTDTIKYLIRKYHIGFENMRISQITSKKLQSLLQNKEIPIEQKRKLDTGKALTAALELEDFNFVHSKITSLLHIGGLSSWILNGDQALVHAEYKLSDTDLYQLASKESWLYNLQAKYDSDNLPFYLRRQQRLSAARFCFQLISHYINNTPKPILNITNNNFINKIDQIESVLQKYIDETS